MVDKQRHKEVIDQQKAITDKDVKVSAKALSILNLRMIFQNRSMQRKLFLKTILKNVDPLFTQVSKLGLSFGQEKMQ